MLRVLAQIYTILWMIWVNKESSITLDLKQLMKFQTMNRQLNYFQYTKYKIRYYEKNRIE